MPGLQEFFPFVCRARQHDLRQHGNLAVVIGVALIIGALDHVGAAEHRPQAALLAQVARAQHDETILRLERAVGGVGMPIAVRLGMHAVAQIAGQMRAHQNHRHIEHGHVDALAAYGALALEQRRCQGESAGHAGSVIDRRSAELDRVHLLGAGHRHDAGGGLDHVIVGGLRPTRAVLAEGGEGGVDQPRIDRRERLVAKPQRLERSRPIVLDEDVGGGGKLLEDVAIRRLFQIERDRTLVGGLREERGAHVATVERLVGAVAAALIGLIGMLDLDHVGAQYSQLVGGKRAGQNVRDVDDSDPFERSHQRGLLGGLLRLYGPFSSSFRPSRDSGESRNP